MHSEERKNIRDRRDQLLTLLNGWDPAGWLHAGAPRDTYEKLADELLDVLMREPHKEEIAAFLERKIDESFRVKPDGAEAFANKLVVWSQLPASLG
jgi:hypothetical protein